MSTVLTLSKHPFTLWWQTARPQTLTAGAAPVLVGSACAWALGAFRFDAALAALLGAMCLQIGTNFANDLGDFVRGADASGRVGPVRAVQAGWVTPSQMRVATMLSFGAAVLAGLYLWHIAGPGVLLVGVVSILAGLAYTHGPWPLAYHGLGDLFVVVFFGPVAVAGTVFVQLGAPLPGLVWWASLPTGMLATAILVVNNLRDRHGDGKVGKRTLAVRFGRAGAEWEYDLCLAVAFAVPLVLLALRWSGPAVLLPWLSAPEALRLRQQVRRLEGSALNPVLGATGRLLGVFALLLAIGLL